MRLDAKQYQLNNKMRMKMNKKAQEGAAKGLSMTMKLIVGAILILLVVLWLASKVGFFDRILE